MTIHRDPIYGHVTMTDGRIAFVILDFGDTCSLTDRPGWDGLHLTQGQARAVGAALLDWVDHKAGVS